MTITQLSYILEIAKEKNFARAAKRCFVTQPTLSMQVQKLEEELGAVLFDRTKKPVEPTPIGAKIIEQARIILQEYNRIRDIIQNESAELKGSLKLAIIPTLSPYILPLFLNKFLQHYPGVELIIEEMQTEQIIRKLQNDEIDVGLLVTPLKKPSIIEEPIFYEPFVVYLSQGHPLLAKASISEKDLSLDEIWLLNEGHCFREQAIEICQKKLAHKDSSRRFFLESGNLETLKRLVDTNYGCTLLPELAVHSWQNTTDLNRLRPFKIPIPTREVSLVYSRAMLKPNLIQAVHKEIYAALPQQYQQTRNARKNIIKIPSYG